MGQDSRDRIDRRRFLALGAAGAGAAALGAHGAAAPGSEASTGQIPADLAPPPDKLLAAPPIPLVRIGFVGVGGMGAVHVQNLLKLDGCEIRALCDIRPERCELARQWCAEAGKPEPKVFSRGETDFRRMCEEEDLDLVFNATPWRWHVPISVAAMENGKHAATEVPAAVTLEECWQLVETAEKHAKHCVMMENVNYGRSELMVLNMVRQGVFGEILHGEGGYLHDLRAIKFSPEGEGLWRRDHSWHRNGNLYPTHGLGPIANCMDINRGDRFTNLVSMSSPSRGLQNYARDNFPEGSSQRDETFALGDVNVSLIQTALGRTIYVSHDTNLPRPYSRINLVQGTRGLFQGYPDRVHVEGKSEGHGWDEADAWRERYEHPLWQKFADAGEGLGHGSMDFLEDHASSAV